MEKLSFWLGKGICISAWFLWSITNFFDTLVFFEGKYFLFFFSNITTFTSKSHGNKLCGILIK